jgi:hypothetical protein
MNPFKRRLVACAVLAASLLGAAIEARADAILDWNVRSEALITESKLGTPPAIRVMAYVQTAAYDAVNAITQRYPAGAARLDAAPNASVDAAVAAAHRAMLAKLIPAQQKAVDAAYQAALAGIPDGPARAAGIAVGEKAAAAVLAQRADDGATPAEPYRPHAQPGAYVPTATPAAPNWGQRKPWLMASPAQFRPAPPPALASDAWARDYNEVKALGGKVSATRSAEQTEIARFWEYSLPGIYHGVVRSVATASGREVTQNARLFAAVAQAMDDGLIGVFEAKYYYNFWRPATAIRNGDIDDPQRRHRRQRRYPARRVVGVVHRQPDAPRVSERSLHPRVRRGHGSPGRAGRRGHAGTGDDEPHRERGDAALDERRRVHPGGG